MKHHGMKEYDMFLTYYCVVYPWKQRRQDSNGSSSDDGTRSSGHASMSDGHLSSSPSVERHQHYRLHLNSVPEDER
jgi:ankyrin repeat/BTB/POZ domain-containing protein 2